MTIRWRGILSLRASESGDHRILENITWRDLPLTLRLQTEDFGAHQGASPVATIDLMELRDVGALADLIASLGVTIPEGAEPLYAEGTFSESEAGQLAAQWVDERVLRGVSVDPGAIEYVEELIDPATGEVVTMEQIMETWDSIDAAEILGEEDEVARLYEWLESLYYRVRFTLYEVAAATLVATPAFGQAVIEIMAEEGAAAPAADAPAPDAQAATTVRERMAALSGTAPMSPTVRQRLSALVVSKTTASGTEQVAAFSPGRMIASGGARRFDPSERPEAQPVTSDGTRQAAAQRLAVASFPDADFEPEQLDRLTKWTIEQDGRMRGHLFSHDGPSSCHRSFTNRCERPNFMDDAPGFPDFHVGDAHLQSGGKVRVGVLTYADLHAPDANLSPEQLVELMENTGRQLGPVRLHVDEFGVQACGHLFDDVTPTQAARALAGFPSYDSRRVAGRWHLFGLHVVNTPGHAIYEETDGEVVRMVASVSPAIGPKAAAALASLSGAPCGCGGHPKGEASQDGTEAPGACSCSGGGKSRLSAQSLANLAHLDAAMATRTPRRVPVR